MQKTIKVLALSALLFTVSSELNLNTAHAKRRPATLKIVDTAASVSKYRIKKGPLYKNYQLTKRATKAQHRYAKKIVYSNETITVRLPSGKKAVYQHLATSKGKSIGYINRHHLKHLTTLPWNFGDADAPYKLLKAEKKAFAKSDLAKIKTLRRQAKSISTSTKKMYVTKPKLKGTFAPGQLRESYIQATVDWINFYRNLFGLSAISSSTSWNTEAQYGATTLAAVHRGLSHGLVAFNKPSFISTSDWQRGAAATGSSNLYTGGNNPFDVITAYINDDGNDVPGHREWLLGGIQQVGVGQAKGYNDLKVFGTQSQTLTPQPLVFPRSGIFPFEAAADGVWSVSLPGKFVNGTPHVKVYDQTTKKNVPVRSINVAHSGYGGFGTSIDYAPQNVKSNHSYQITMTQLPGGQADLHYTTKLFTLMLNQ